MHKQRATMPNSIYLIIEGNILHILVTYRLGNQSIFQLMVVVTIFSTAIRLYMLSMLFSNLDPITAGFGPVVYGVVLLLRYHYLYRLLLLSVGWHEINQQILIDTMTHWPEELCEFAYS